MADAGDPSAPLLTRLEPGTVFAGYRIEGLLDRGGMGVVYRATDLDLDRSIALKLIAPEHTQNPTAVARFKAEARLAASLEHPNIVPIHRGGEHEGVLYLAMRLVPGTNLREVINGGPLDLARTARILGEVADALDTAHAAGLVHRDVKPANILVCGDEDHEHAYLTDFGLTKRLGSAGDLTRTGGWVGTPDYVAPEQIQGHGVDGRADIYSLGCVVYEMLTGRVAYPKDSHMAKLWAHVTDPPPLPRRHRPDLVESFDAVVARATAKAPADRFATAGELAAALQAAVGEQEAKRQFEASQPTRAAQGQEPDTTRDEVFVDRPLQDTPPGLAVGPPARDASGAAAAAPVPAAAGGPRGSRPPEAPSTSGGPAAAGAVRASAAPAAASAASGVQANGHRRRRWPLAAAAGLLLVAAVAIAAILIAGGSSGDGGGGGAAAQAGTPVTGELAAVPLSHVYRGVGNVVMRLTKDNEVTVDIKASGLLDGFPHLMHIHSNGQGTCPPPGAATVHGGYRVITTQNGADFYGHVATSLTEPPGKTDAGQYLDRKNSPKAVPLTYARQFRLDPVVAAQIRQNIGAVIVIHGIDYNHNGRYDDVLERDDAKHSHLPIEETAPALCGALTAKEPQRGRQTASATRVYTATLGPTDSAPSAVPLLCHLSSVAGRLL